MELNQAVQLAIDGDENCITMKEENCKLSDIGKSYFVLSCSEIVPDLTGHHCIMYLLHEEHGFVRRVNCSIYYPEKGGNFKIENVRKIGDAVLCFEAVIQQCRTAKSELRRNYVYTFFDSDRQKLVTTIEQKRTKLVTPVIT